MITNSWSRRRLTMITAIPAIPAQHSPPLVHCFVTFYFPQNTYFFQFSLVIHFCCPIISSHSASFYSCNVQRLVLLSVRIHTDKCVISGLLSVWIRTAVCASIYHTIHTLTLTLSLDLTLTLNLTLISSYLTNKHQ